MRLPITLAAMAIGVLWQDAVAVACSCGVGAPRVVPANGAMGIPVNGSVFVIPDPNDNSQVMVSVIDVGTNAAVPTVIEDHGPWLRFTAAFEAFHEYDVVVSVNGTASHSLFITGTEMDVVPPSFAGITALGLETMRWPIVQPDGSGCSGGCVSVNDGHISRTRINFEPPSGDVALLVFARYRASDRSLIDEFVLDQPWSEQAMLGDSICGAIPVLEPGVAYCGKVLAYDSAANVSGTVAEVCSDVVVCDPELDPVSTCSPSKECHSSPSASGCNSTDIDRTPVVEFFGLVALFMFRKRKRTPDDQRRHA